VLTHLLCPDVNNGSIELHIKGGIAPYSCLWDDNSTEQSRSNLSGGVYNLTVTDANGCTQTADITLTAPEPLTIDLGKDLILCKNITAELNASLTNNKGVKYRWYKNEQPLDQTSAIITVQEQGIYSVEVTTIDGCIVKDTINISTRDYEIAADFAVASETVNDEHTKLVNISYPYPDKVEWIIPEDNPAVKVISLSDEYAEIMLTEKDSYRIGLHTWRGDCETTVYKIIEINDDIQISDNENIPKPESESTSLIKSLIAYPSPNNGQFTVHVELGIKSDIRLCLMSLNGRIINDRTLKGNNRYDVYYNMNGISGVYIIHLLAGKKHASLKLIINAN
jgi:hypothetical protein